MVSAKGRRFSSSGGGFDLLDEEETKDVNEGINAVLEELVVSDVLGGGLVVVENHPVPKGEEYGVFGLRYDGAGEGSFVDGEIGSGVVEARLDDPVLRAGDAVFREDCTRDCRPEGDVGILGIDEYELGNWLELNNELELDGGSKLNIRLEIDDDGVKIGDHWLRFGSCRL